MLVLKKLATKTSQACNSEKRPWQEFQGNFELSTTQTVNFKLNKNTAKSEKAWLYPSSLLKMQRLKDLGC